MGLDQYLDRKTYVKNWSHTKSDQITKITVERNGKPIKGIDTKNIYYLIETAAVWRKANQIHSWFVENVQNGRDDCGTYDVSQEQLERLLGIVEQVLTTSELVDGKVCNGYTFDTNNTKVPIMEKGKLIKDSSVASELLPTGTGFFFGSTDYDEYYYDQLLNTKKILVTILADKNDAAEYTYHSSW